VWDERGRERGLGVTDTLETLINAAPGETRAEHVHAAALHLRETSAYARVMLCELSYVMTAPSSRSTVGRPDPGLWHEIRRADGTSYRSQHDYLRVLWGAQYSRASLSARKRLGQGVTAFPCEQREWLRRQLAEIGLMKALALGPVIAGAPDAERLETWLSRAADPLTTSDHLRRWVSELMGTTRPDRANQPHTRCPTCGRAWKPRGKTTPVLPVVGDKVARRGTALATR